MIKTVKVKKKEYPVYFGYNALAEFTDASGITIDTLLNLGTKGEGLTFSQARNLIYCGIKEGHRKQKKKFSMTSYDVGDLFDPISENIEIFHQFMKIFAEQIGVPDEKNQKAPVKKK